MKMLVKGSSINDGTQFWKFFDQPSPHCHAFYYWGLSTVVTKSFTPSPLRPWRHLWTTPKSGLPLCFCQFLTKLLDRIRIRSNYFLLLWMVSGGGSGFNSNHCISDIDKLNSAFWTQANFWQWPNRPEKWCSLQKGLKSKKSSW